MSNLIRLSHPALAEGPGGKSFIMVEGQRIVCPSCNGTGSHVRRDIDDSRLIDSMREDGDDEGIRSYFRGSFDVTCEECKGRNVVDAPIWEKVPEWARNEIEAWNREEAADRNYSRQERMACGCE